MPPPVPPVRPPGKRPIQSSSRCPCRQSKPAAIPGAQKARCATWEHHPNPGCRRTPLRPIPRQTAAPDCRIRFWSNRHGRPQARSRQPPGPSPRSKSRAPPALHSLPAWFPWKTNEPGETGLPLAPARRRSRRRRRTLSPRRSILRRRLRPSEPAKAGRQRLRRPPRPRPPPSIWPRLRAVAPPHRAIPAPTGTTARNFRTRPMSRPRPRWNLPGPRR